MAVLRAIDVPPGRAPSMIDEYPILAVIAAFAAGTTRLRGLKELRVKESDRLAATAALLAVQRRETDHRGRRSDRSWHRRSTPAGGGLVATHMDHRIAMSALVLGQGSAKPVRIDDSAFIDTSFPDFVGLMRGIGAGLEPTP